MTNPSPAPESPLDTVLESLGILAALCGAGLVVLAAYVVAPALAFLVGGLFGLAVGFGLAWFANHPKGGDRR